MASKDTPKKQKKHDLRTTHPGEEERETDFGTDQEVPRKHSQGASPNPEHRRPTYKSMKHKVFKTFGLEKSSSASQAVVENQESTKDDAGVSDFSNMITQLKTSPGNERKRLAMPNRTETKSEPTLVVGGDKSISQDDDDDVKQEVGVQVVTVHPLSQDETSSFRSSSLSAVSCGIRFHIYLLESKASYLCKHVVFFSKVKP